MYIEKIIDHQTGEETIREYTKAEIAEVEANIKKAEAITKAELDRIAARQSALAKLAALGLTEDEIAAL